MNRFQSFVWRFLPLLVILAAVVSVARCQTGASLSLVRQSPSVAAHPGSVVPFDLVLSGSGGKVAAIQWNLATDVGLSATVTAPSSVTVKNGGTVSCASSAGPSGSQICVLYNLSVTSGTLPDGPIATVTVTVPISATGTVHLGTASTLGASTAGDAVTVASGAALAIPVSATGAASFDGVADLGVMASGVTSFTSGAYSSNGSMVFLWVTCGGCSNIYPVTAVSWGSAALSPVPGAAAASAAGGGTGALWSVQAPTGSAPFTVSSSGAGSVHLLAASYAGVSGFDVAPVVNTTPLGNAFLHTQVTTKTAGDILTAFSNGVAPSTSDNAQVRAVASSGNGALFDMQALAPSSYTVDIQVAFQGAAYPNIVVVVSLLPSGVSVPLTTITPQWFTGVTASLPPACPGPLVFVVLTDARELAWCTTGSGWNTLAQWIPQPTGSIWTGPVCGSQTVDSPYNGSGLNQDGLRVPMSPWSVQNTTQRATCLAYYRKIGVGFRPESCCTVAQFHGSRTITR